MIITSATYFVDALKNPSSTLRNSLGGGFLAAWPEEQITVCSHARYFEATLPMGERAAHLYTPLTEAAREQMASIACRLAGVQSRHLASYRFVAGLFTFFDAQGREQRADGVVESLPAGRLLSDVLTFGVCAREVLAALRQLRDEFMRLGIAHNLLKAENLWLTNQGTLMAVRLHRLTFRGETSADREAFRAIEELILAADSPSTKFRFESNQLPTEGTIRQEGAASEGLIRISRDGVYGFMTTQGVIRIEPQFLWAEDFREGRAEVQCASGMGLINKQGEFVIEPCYEDIDYDERSGEVRVRQNGEWGLRNYEGEWLIGVKEEDSKRSPQSLEK